MEKEQLEKLIGIASGREPADFVIKNCKVIDVFNAVIKDGDIAFCDGIIAGVGEYTGKRELDAEGKYAAPGFIDSHIHIESSYVTPEELGSLLVPHGTTTIMADPHEIVNVCGMEGLSYMAGAAGMTALDIKLMLPSCVPATPFENSGAVLDADAMSEALDTGVCHGVGEFMNFPGIIHAESTVLDKIIAAKKHGVPIDGHSPGVTGQDLNAYVAAGILTDHECSTVEEMQDRIARGMYVLLRQGSACHDLEILLKGITSSNSRRCLLCTDDCQIKTVKEKGHLDNHLRLCLEGGIDAITAIQMATLNAAECYGMKDRGAIAPGLRADVVLLDDLKGFKVSHVFIEGREAAALGTCLLNGGRFDSSAVQGKFNVKGFSEKTFHLHFEGHKANVIEIQPGGVLTKKRVMDIAVDAKGEFVFDSHQDIVKAAVIERHHGTGNSAVALLKGYGLKTGAIAVSVAHDSHNVIVVGASDADMALAAETLISQGGGIVLADKGQVLENMPLPIAGLMSGQSAAWVEGKLVDIHRVAYEVLGISKEIDPIMTLSFMSLSVIPELKLTDMGLFDVTKMAFISHEA